MAIFLFSLVFAIYTSVSLIWGDRGVLAYMDLKRNYLGLQQVADTLADQRTLMEQEVRFLRNNNLDVDRLEEEARQSLKVIADDEVVIMRHDF